MDVESSERHYTFNIRKIDAQGYELIEFRNIKKKRIKQLFIYIDTNNSGLKVPGHY